MSVPQTRYESLKSSLCSLLPNHTVVNTALQTIQTVKTTLLPAALNAIPEKISCVVKDYFVAMPPVILLTNLAFGRSLINLNLVDSAIVYGMSKVDRHGTNKSLVDDASFVLCALHSIKFCYNAASLLWSRDLASLWSTGVDLALATEAGLIFLNKRGFTVHSTTL